MSRECLLSLGAVLAAGACLGVPPEYTIVDLGVVSGHTAAQGLGISPGGVGVGRSLPSSGSAQAISWTQSGGLVALPALTSPVRAYAVANDANDAGLIVGTASSTAFGSSPLPVAWQGGSVLVLPLPAGQTLGRANAVNASGVAVGSVNSGTLEIGTIYTLSTASTITQTTGDGSTLRTAFGINDAGRVVGFGVNPGNAAVNVGYVLDTSTNTAFTVGALSGANGAICFGVGNAGHVVGSSMMNQGSGRPFIWHDSTGIVEIPLPSGTSQGSARAVNSSGWAVGTASSAFAIPFLYDGTASYRLADLLPSGSPWDLSTNTSSSALGISDAGIIVGTGVLGGAIRAYAMIPVPSCPCPADFDDGTGTGTCDGGVTIDDLLYYLDIFDAGSVDADVDDGTGTGTQDGGVTIDDLIYYLFRFDSGC